MFSVTTLNDENELREGKERLLSCLQKVRCRYAYIRIPKTGSASLNRSLYNATMEAATFRNSAPHLKNALFQSPPDWWDHYSAKWCKKIIGESAWNDIFSFTVVRNPYARLYSIWNYEEWLKKECSFEKWVLEGCKSPWQSALARETFPNDPVGSQKSWVFDAEDNLVNFIFRLEDMQTVGSPALGDLLGTDRFYIHQHRMNQTAVVDEYKNHYTQEMIDFVTQLCVEDLEMFKYNFEGVTESDWFYMREL